MRATWIVLTLAASCGRVGFEPLASFDARPCDPAADFGTPVAIAELDSATADDGTLRLLPDELTGYYWSQRSGNDDIYLVTRPALDAPFTIATITGINTASDELDPAPSADNSVLVYRHHAPGDDLDVATTDAPDTFTSLGPIAVLDTPNTEVQPFVEATGDEMIFASSRSGGGDLYRTTRTGTTFITPTKIAELATACEEGDPAVSSDGLTIYFRSSRDPAGTALCLDFNIWTATRPTLASPFGAAVLVPGVSSPSDEGPSWLSGDGCRLYLSSSRAGTNDVYVATKPL